MGTALDKYADMKPTLGLPRRHRVAHQRRPLEGDESEHADRLRRDRRGRDPLLGGGRRRDPRPQHQLRPAGRERLQGLHAHLGQGAAKAPRHHLVPHHLQQPAAARRGERAGARRVPQRATRTPGSPASTPASPCSPPTRDDGRLPRSGRSSGSTISGWPASGGCCASAASRWSTASTSRGTCGTPCTTSTPGMSTPGSMWDFYLIGDYGLTAMEPIGTNGMKPSLESLYYYLWMIEEAKVQAPLVHLDLGSGRARRHRDPAPGHRAGRPHQDGTGAVLRPGPQPDQPRTAAAGPGDRAGRGPAHRHPRGGAGSVPAQLSPDGTSRASASRTAALATSTVTPGA